MIKTIFLLSLLSVFPLSVSASTLPITYTCKYNTFSNQKGLHKAEKGFVLRFILDIKNKSAYMMGNIGSEKVAPVKGEDGTITFIEITETGNVTTTAIS